MRLLYCSIDVTYLLLGGGSFLPRHCRKALRASTLGTISSSYSQIDKWTTCMTTWTVCWSSSRRGCWFRCWARGRGGWTIRQSGSTRGKICSDISTWRHCSASPTRANLVLRIIAWFWCNLLEQIKLLCLIWKLWMSSFICCMAACSAPRGYRVTDLNVEGWWMRPAHLKNTSKIYLSVGPWSKFIYQ